MTPICIFFHCVFAIGEPPKRLDNASLIVGQQMEQLAKSGLLAAATEMHVGVNGSAESKPIIERTMPRKSKVTYHGLQCRNENPTIVMLEEWVKTHPGWNVLYFHSKGASQPTGSAHGMFSKHWRGGMMQDMVMNWKQCVHDLDAGHDIVASNWFWGMADGTQHIPPGNFLWMKSDFAAKLPSINERDRIKQDGIGALSSRYEAEVHWGFGPRPNVKTYRQGRWPW